QTSWDVAHRGLRVAVVRRGRIRRSVDDVEKRKPRHRADDWSGGECDHAPDAIARRDLTREDDEAERASRDRETRVKPWQQGEREAGCDQEARRYTFAMECGQHAGHDEGG